MTRVNLIARDNGFGLSRNLKLLHDALVEADCEVTISGIRRGAEILMLKALGADFTFVGRATLYGVVAGGRAGADKAIAILRNELDMSLAMIGCPRFSAIGREILLSREEESPCPLPSMART